MIIRFHGRQSTNWLWDKVFVVLSQRAEVSISVLIVWVLMVSSLMITVMCHSMVMHLIHTIIVQHLPEVSVSTSQTYLVPILSISTNHCGL